MRCEKCGGEAKVVDSGKRGKYVFRKRKCSSCGYVFFTRELPDSKAGVFLRRARNKIAKGGDSK